MQHVSRVTLVLEEAGLRDKHAVKNNLRLKEVYDGREQDGL